MNAPLEEAMRRQRNLNDFAAPFFSGMSFSMGIILIGLEHWTTAIFPLAAALGYWSRLIYLFMQERKAWAQIR